MNLFLRTATRETVHDSTVPPNCTILGIIIIGGGGLSVRGKNSQSTPKKLKP